MTKDEILSMAREAGICTWTIPPESVLEQWERFAALVAVKAAQDEREACEKLCDEMMKGEMTSAGENDGRGSDIAFGRMVGAECLADAIRARG